MMPHGDLVFRRMDRSTCGWTRISERTAEQVVNHIDERQLADVIYEFGEERRSRRIPEPLSGRGRYDLPHILRR